MNALAAVILTFFIVNAVFASVPGLAVDDVRLRKRRGNHSLLINSEALDCPLQINKQCPHPMI